MIRKLEGEVKNIENSFIEGNVNHTDFKSYDKVAVFHNKKMISQLKLQDIIKTNSNKKLISSKRQSLVLLIFLSISFFSFRIENV